MIISLVLDILSLAVIRNRNDMPMFLVNGVCKAYLIFLLLSVRLALAYILTDVFSEKIHRKIDRIIWVLCMVQSIIICLLPIYIYDKAGAMYTYGPVTIFLYTMVVLDVVTIITVIVGFYKKLNTRRAFAVSVWMIVWMVGAIIQFFKNEILIVGFAGAMGVVILYAIMENPETNLDRGLGCFNAYAMGEYITSLMERKQDFSVLKISFEESDM